MRVAYLHQYFNTPDMAGSTRSYEIGRRLVASGHQVEVITSWREPSHEKEWFVREISGMSVHWLPVQYSNHMGYAARVRAFVSFAVSAARRAASLNCDVVFATSTPLTIALPGVYAARRKRVPMVFEVRDLWPDLPIAVGALRDPLSRWAAYRLEKFAYRNSARIVALSTGMAEGIARTGYPPGKITVVPNGSDLGQFARDPLAGAEFRRQYGIPLDAILVGYVGTLGKVNAVSYFVEMAAALASEPRMRFLVVGDGLERAKITELARTLGVLDRNLLMLSKMPKRQMPQVLSALDIATSLFLPLPQLEANSANKFFDALAAGCCVCVNYGGWQAELVESIGCGVRLDANPTRAARQLHALAADRDHLQSMGRKARELAEARFSRDDLSAQVERVLCEVVAGAARGTA